MMNVTILQGRLTRDPEVHYAPGTDPLAIARYSLAVDRPRKQDGQQGVDFIPCVAFGGRGKFAENYLKKGMMIAIRGHIQTGSYTNREGNKVYTTEVVVDEHSFCESRNTSRENSGMNEYNSQQNITPQTERQPVNQYNEQHTYRNPSNPTAPTFSSSAPGSMPFAKTQSGGFLPNSKFSNNSNSGYHQDPALGDGFMNIPDGIEEELPFN